MCPRGDMSADTTSTTQEAGSVPVCDLEHIQQTWRMHAVHPDTERNTSTALLSCAMDLERLMDAHRAARSKPSDCTEPDRERCPRLCWDFCNAAEGANTELTDRGGSVK